MLLQPGLVSWPLVLSSNRAVTVFAWELCKCRLEPLGRGAWCMEVHDMVKVMQGMPSPMANAATATSIS